MFIARRLMYCFQKKILSNLTLSLYPTKTERLLQRIILKVHLIYLLRYCRQVRVKGIWELKKLYVKNGVREYWIVDPEQEIIEVLNLKEGEFRSKSYNTGVVGQTSRLSSFIIQGFDIDIKEIFV